MTYNGKQYPVTSIAPSALKGVYSKTIVIGPNVEHIGEGAFSYPACTSGVFDVGSNKHFRTDRDGCLLVNSDISKMIAAHGRSTIPKEVKEILPYAFAGTDVKFVDLPKGLIAIGDGAFKDCASLDSVSCTLDSSLRAVGNEAFRGCSSLSSFGYGSELGSTLPQSLESIGDWAFGGCSELSSLVWEKSSLKTIGSHTFSGCKSLENFIRYVDGAYGYEMPYELSSIGEYAFENSGLCSFSTGGADLETIGASAFKGCDSLGKVHINGQTHIGRAAFAGLPNLISVSTFGADIGAEAFMRCSSLSELDIDQISIGPRAFANCALKSTGLPSDGTSHPLDIGEYAYSGNPNLKDVILPEGVRSIGEYAFAGDGSVETMHISSTVQHVGKGAFNFGSDAFDRIEVQGPDGTEDADALYIGSELVTVTSHPEEGGGKLTVREGTESMAPYAFFNNRSTKQVILPPSLETIGDFAFCDRTNVRNVNLEHVVSIGDSAFRESGLREAVFGKSLVNIGAQAFYHASHLEKMSFATGAFAAGEKAFSIGWTSEDGVAIYGLSPGILEKSSDSDTTFTYHYTLHIIFPGGEWDSYDDDAIGGTLTQLVGYEIEGKEMTLKLNGKVIDASDFFSMPFRDSELVVTYTDKAPVGPTGPTDPTDPVDPTGPTEPVGPTEPTGPSGPGGTGSGTGHGNGHTLTIGGVTLDLRVLAAVIVLSLATCMLASFVARRL